MSSYSETTAHFLHVDLDGDKLEAIETENGSVFYAWGTEGDHVAVALHAGPDTQALIDYLNAVQESTQ